MGKEGSGWGYGYKRTSWNLVRLSILEIETACLEDIEKDFLIACNEKSYLNYG